MSNNFDDEWRQHTLSATLFDAIDKVFDFQGRGGGILCPIECVDSFVPMFMTILKN